MASPISKGRMIRQDISKSKKFASLSKDSQILFCLLIPHFNSYGKMNGNAHYIKGEIVPLLQFDVPLIEKCLREIHKKTNVKWFSKDGIRYIQAINFDNHQELREDRRGKDLLPNYSETSPGLIRHEVEGEVEGEVESKAQSLKLKAEKTTLRDLPHQNGKDNPFIEEVVRYCGDAKSRAYFILAEKQLGEGLLRECFGELKMRVNEGQDIQNRGAYLVSLIKDRK